MMYPKPKLIGLSITFCMGMVGLSFEAQAETTALSKAFTFLGYSEDETLAAWRMHVVRVDKERGIVDRYTLIQVIDPETDRVTQTYRASKVTRHFIKRRTHRALGYHRASSDNPQWKDALPRRSWLALRFHKKFQEPVQYVQHFGVSLKASEHTL